MSIKLPIEEGDIILTGRFKNKRTKVRSIGEDEYGHPTINGKPILKFKIEKLLPKEKKSKKTREDQNPNKEETEYRMGKLDSNRFKKLAGILTEQRDDDEPVVDENIERLIDEYKPYFEKAGFGPYMIDFGDADPEAIEAMGEALKKLYG